MQQTVPPFPVEHVLLTLPRDGCSFNPNLHLHLYLLQDPLVQISELNTTALGKSVIATMTYTVRL